MGCLDYIVLTLHFLTSVFCRECLRLMIDCRLTRIPAPRGSNSNNIPRTNGSSIRLPSPLPSIIQSGTATRRYNIHPRCCIDLPTIPVQHRWSHTNRVTISTYTTKQHAKRIHSLPSRPHTNARLTLTARIRNLNSIIGSMRSSMRIHDNFVDRKKSSSTNNGKLLCSLVYICIPRCNIFHSRSYISITSYASGMDINVKLRILWIYHAILTYKRIST